MSILVLISKSQGRDSFGEYVDANAIVDSRTMKIHTYEKDLIRVLSYLSLNREYKIEKVSSKTKRIFFKFSSQFGEALLI